MEIRAEMIPFPTELNCFVFDQRDLTLKFKQIAIGEGTFTVICEYPAQFHLDDLCDFLHGYTLTVSPALMHTVLPLISAHTSMQVGLWKVCPSALVQTWRQALT